MKLLFPSSGNGDCIFCLLEKKDGTYCSMMIDCHCFTSKIKAIVTDMLHCHLDYLVVTHIDIDHINGICNMLYQMPELRVDHIIYNNLFVKKDDAQVEPLTDFQQKQIEELKTSIPTWKPNIEKKVAKKDSLALSTLIQRNWADAWNKKLTFIADEYLSLGELGTMFIVSPTQIAIDELNKQILDEFAQKFYEKYPLKQGKEKGAELFELLSLLYNRKELLFTENKISSSTSTMRAEYEKSDKEDTSKTNRASIAFVWEFGDKKILLLGDATSEIVIEGIKAYKKKNKIPLEEKVYFDAIKVSHHGSDVNLSKELLKHIDSPNWIFCGSTNSAPHIHTLANIIYQPLLDNIKKRRLCFNSVYYKNDIFNKIKTKVSVLEKEGIKIEVVQINEMTL